MKKIIYRIFIIAVISTFTVSCDDLLDINEDPNSSLTANVQEVLSSAQAQIALWSSNNLNQATMNMWSQYWAWGPGVNLGPVPQYDYGATLSNGRWSRAYASALQDLTFVSEGGEPVYTAISTLLKAYIYGMLVDMFGDVPFSEANQGLDYNFSPVFDDDAAIYVSIIESIDVAKEEIEATIDMVANDITPLPLIPGDNDLFYQGVLENWVMFANSLKLKLLVRQTENGGPSDLETQIQNVVAEGNFIESNDDNAKLEWIGEIGSENPFYATSEDGLGNFYVLSTTTDSVLTELGDPRLDVFYEATSTGHVAGRNGAQLSGSYSNPSDAVYGPDLPSLIMTASEIWFYRAEAAELYATEDASNALMEAIGANFDYYGISGSVAYFNTLDYSLAADKIGIIGVQMWIAMNAAQSAEGWVATRKFDTPSRPLFASSGGIFISPLSNVLGDFPSILLYPQSEINYNSNVPAQHSLTDKVFWDN